MMGVPKNPHINLGHQVMPLIEVGCAQVTFVAITRDLLDRTVMSDHHRFAVEFLR